MIGILHLIDPEPVSRKIAAVHNVVDPEPKPLFIKGVAIPVSRTGKRIAKPVAFDFCIGIGNRDIIKIAAKDNGQIRLGNLFGNPVRLLRTELVRTSQLLRKVVYHFIDPVVSILLSHVFYQHFVVFRQLVGFEVAIEYPHFSSLNPHVGVDC